MRVIWADLHFENISPRPGDNGKEKTKQMRGEGLIGYAAGSGKRWGPLCPNEAAREMGRSDRVKAFRRKCLQEAV